MAYCPSCGAEVSKGAAFCSECGESLQDDTAQESDPEPEEATADVGGGELIETADEEPVAPEQEGRDYGRIVKAVGFALIPAFIAYMMLSLASGGDPVVFVFFLAIPVFGYLIYQREGTKAMAGGMCYYLAIEFLLSPLVFLIYTFAFASEQTSTAAGQAGAALGGFVLVVAAFVIGLPLALALYLVSRRLDTEEGSGGDGAPA